MYHFLSISWGLPRYQSSISLVLPEKQAPWSKALWQYTQSLGAINQASVHWCDRARETGQGTISLGGVRNVTLTAHKHVHFRLGMSRLCCWLSSEVLLCQNGSKWICCQNPFSVAMRKPGQTALDSGRNVSWKGCGSEGCLGEAAFCRGRDQASPLFPRCFLRCGTELDLSRSVSSSVRVSGVIRCPKFILPVCCLDLESALSPQSPGSDPREQALRDPTLHARGIHFCRVVTDSKISSREREDM